MSTEFFSVSRDAMEHDVWHSDHWSEAAQDGVKGSFVESKELRLTPPKQTRLRFGNPAAGPCLQSLDNGNTHPCRTASEALPRLLEGLRAFMDAQRACMREAEGRFQELERRGYLLEAEFCKATGSPISSRGGAKDTDAAAREPILKADAPSGGKRRAPNAIETPKSQDTGSSPMQPPGQPLCPRSTVLTPDGKLRPISQVKVESASPTSAGKERTNTILIRLQEEEKAEEEAEKQQIEEVMHRKPLWKRIVQSPKFDLLLGGLIVANTVVMSLQIEYEGRILEQELAHSCEHQDCMNMRWPNVQLLFAVLEQIFTAIFALELLARLAAEGCRYLRQVPNMGDALIVVVSGIDSWLLTPSSAGVQNVAILRLVRLVRLSKVLRVVRVMKAFKSLRVMVSAVANSVGALAWSMTLLFVFELIGAIFLAQVLQPIIADKEQDRELRDFVCKRFGTWMHAMLSLFEITMAPGGFIPYRRLYEEIHPLFGLFMMVYVCVVTFAVVRVITAMFLKATLSASDSDEARQSKEKAEKREAYAQRLSASVDADGSGGIDESEFRMLLEVPKMKEWMEDALLSPTAAMRLFRAMDNGSGEISFTDFVAALLRIRGGPKGADSVIMLHESLQIFERVKRTERAVFGAAEEDNLAAYFPALAG